MSQPTALNNTTTRNAIAAYFPASMDSAIVRRLVDDVFKLYASDPDHRTVHTMMITWFGMIDNVLRDAGFSIEDRKDATTVLEWYARTLEGPAIS